MEAVKAVINDIRCKYNLGVICSSWTTKSTAAKCEKCGWHKGVSTARLNARGLYWEIQRRKWLKQLQPHKVRRDPEADDDQKA